MNLPLGVTDIHLQAAIYLQTQIQTGVRFRYCSEGIFTLKRTSKYYLLQVYLIYVIYVILVNKDASNLFLCGKYRPLVPCSNKRGIFRRIRRQ